MNAQHHILPSLLVAASLTLAACTAQIGGPEPEPGAPPEDLGTFSSNLFPTGASVEVCNFKGGLPFRRDASPTAAIIRYLPEGTPGMVRDRLYLWYKLEIGGTLGWAYGTALCLVKPPPAPQPDQDPKPQPDQNPKPQPDQSKAPACASYSSGAADYAPVQTTGPMLTSGKLLPPGYAQNKWSRSTQAPDYTVPFIGKPWQKAQHEGIDRVIGRTGPVNVPVRAIADGSVVYVRIGCPQKCAGDPAGMFCHNTASRECGGGWGNHVVVAHAGGVFSRYAHLEPGSVPAGIRAGRSVKRGQEIGRMGNSGRSEMRHLHLELGTRKKAFDPCASAQSMDLVFDPGQLPW